MTHLSNAKPIDLPEWLMVLTALKIQYDELRTDLSFSEWIKK
jgi:hypothetical protein